MKTYSSEGCADAMVADGEAAEQANPANYGRGKIASDNKQCPSCHAAAEEWWSYCALCGWHIASGVAP